ncbi:MAG: porphobilinogen synthase [Bacteroidetes bacterium]|nr:porphobilinogen synthase [Bacteroidota bacterium]
MLIRPRRRRSSAPMREMVKETSLELSNLIYPLFLVDGTNVKTEIASLPGNYRFSIEHLLREIDSCVKLGLHSFILFPSVEDKHKDKTATYSYSSKNFYLKAIREIKKRFPQIILISDVAMDPYSSDGHDGLVKDDKIVNDETLPILANMALAQAEAGIDIIGPSDMMDGRVGFLREALDGNGFSDISIMSYTAKYASAFYGPFRDALNSAPKKGDKKSYQMDPRNINEAMLEAELDYSEGADFLMVKPALHYLDVVKTLKENFDIPIAAYHVSGECAMLTAACKNGWLDFNKAMPETLYSMRRAGADVILTYFAKDYAKLIKA